MDNDRRDEKNLKIHSLSLSKYDLQTRKEFLMARHRSRPGFYSTIEYIGPRPQKPKRRNFFGGWVIGVIALGIACWFGYPLVDFLKAAQEGVSTQQAESLVAILGKSPKAGDRLAAAALAHSNEKVVYDPAYYKIGYPNGDIAPGKGAAADVVIRCLRRAANLDLQKEVHEDMAAHFRPYPQLWGASAPDPNIDHRRVANLQRFFERKGETLAVSRNAADYLPGDIVIWSLSNADPHIGIVVPGPGNRANEAWVVHNIGAGVKWEDILFDHKIEGHFRYPAATTASPGKFALSASESVSR